MGVEHEDKTRVRWYVDTHIRTELWIKIDTDGISADVIVYSKWDGHEYDLIEYGRVSSTTITGRKYRFDKPILIVHPLPRTLFCVGQKLSRTDMDRIIYMCITGDIDRFIPDTSEVHSDDTDLGSQTDASHNENTTVLSDIGRVIASEVCRNVYSAYVHSKTCNYEHNNSPNNPCKVYTSAHFTNRILKLGSNNGT